MDLLEIKKQHISAYHWPSSGFYNVFSEDYVIQATCFDGSWSSSCRWRRVSGQTRL